MINKLLLFLLSICSLLYIPAVHSNGNNSDNTKSIEGVVISGTISDTEFEINNVSVNVNV